MNWKKSSKNVEGLGSFTTWMWAHISMQVFNNYCQAE